MQKGLRASPADRRGLVARSSAVNGKESGPEGVSKWSINYLKHEPSLLWMLYLESLLLIISSNIPLPLVIWIIINIDTVVLQLYRTKPLLFCSPATLKWETYFVKWLYILSSNSPCQKYEMPEKLKRKLKTCEL